MREDDAIARCRAALEAGSKSFAFAARLLPARCRDDAAVLYAWCRRADDAIDEALEEARASHESEAAASEAELPQRQELHGRLPAISFPRAGRLDG